MKREKKLTLVTIARNFASRGGAFIFAVLGVLCQMFHTGLVAYLISSMGSNVKMLQAVMIAIFLSCALLYFTLIADEKNQKVNKQIRMFFYFEAFVNTWYYAHKMIFEKGDTILEMLKNADWTLLIVSIPFAIFIPLSLKSYASEIRTKDPEDEDRIIDKNLLEELKTELQKSVNEAKIDLKQEDLLKEIDELKEIHKKLSEYDFEKDLENINKFISNQSNFNTDITNIKDDNKDVLEKLNERINTLSDKYIKSSEITEQMNSNIQKMNEELKNKVSANKEIKLHVQGSDGKFGRPVTSKIE